MTPENGVPDSVRLALPAEAEAIATIQRRKWTESLEPEVSDHLLTAVTLEQMVEVWRAAITKPPQARFRVLVAIDENEQRVAGFATTIPSADGDADPSTDGCIDEFTIDPPALRRGHGSRLLNACVDTLRADGFTRATCWVTASDDHTRAFLTAAGWAADGSYRELGDDTTEITVKQVRLHTDISARD